MIDIRDVILYSTGCPRCKVLKSKLSASNIEFEEITDVEEMQRIGLKSAPSLLVDGKLMGFNESIQWVNRNSR